jgi:hypothetical protein
VKRLLTTYTNDMRVQFVILARGERMIIKKQELGMITKLARYRINRENSTNGINLFLATIEIE